MNKPIMAKATAVWLVDNTTLSFRQIAEFCGLHELEVQGIADGDVAAGVKGFDPIQNNQLEPEEIEKGEKDPSYSLKLKYNAAAVGEEKRRGPRYTPLCDPAAALERIGDVMGRGLAVDGGIEGEDHLVDSFRCDTVDEPGDTQLVRADRVERRQRASENVIATPEGPRTLHRPEVGHVGDNADFARRALLALADPADVVR